MRSNRFSVDGRNNSYIKNMKLIYEARIFDEDEEVSVAKVSALSQESLEEEMGKPKFAKAVEAYKNYRLALQVAEDEGKELPF